MTTWRALPVWFLLSASCGQSGSLKLDGHAGDGSRPETQEVPAAPDGAVPDAGTADAHAQDGAHADAVAVEAAATDGQPADRNHVDLAGRDLSASADATVAADGPSASVACSALEPLARRGVLTERRADQVVFAPDRSWIALKTSPPPESSSTTGQVVLISLPDGDVKLIADSATSVERLGESDSLLIFAPSGNGTNMKVYDGAGSRDVANGVCYHQATPDGTRVYFMECYASIVSPLKVVDVAAGTVTVVADIAIQGTLTISPDSRWAAFVVRDRTVGDMIRVADAKNNGYAIASQIPALSPAFATNDLLLFTANGSGSYPSPNEDVRGHVPGSGDVSYPIITGRDPARNRLSPGGSLLLGAASEAGRTDAYLYAIRTDGTGETLIASDLYAYWRVTRPLRSFSFDSSGRWILYMHAGVGVSVASASGGGATKLSEQGVFQASPNTGEVVLLDDVDGRMGARLRVVALDTGTELLSFESEGTISDAAALPGAPRLVFIETTLTDSRRLRFISSAVPGSIVLGEWTTSRLLPADSPLADPQGSYPVDPTGCFTILDSNLPPTTGVSLVLLPE